MIIVQQEEKRANVPVPMMKIMTVRRRKGWKRCDAGATTRYRKDLEGS